MVFSAVLLTILASSPSLIEAWALAKFHTPVEHIVSPKVDLASHPIGRKYRTRIRQTIEREGANFAGGYTLVKWGCGTSCTQFAIVELRTGRIFHNPELIAARGVEFQKNTRLLIFNPDDADGVLFPNLRAEYFEWTGKELRKVKPPRTAG